MKHAENEEEEEAASKTNGHVMYLNSMSFCAIFQYYNIECEQHFVCVSVRVNDCSLLCVLTHCIYTCWFIFLYNRYHHATDEAVAAVALKSTIFR